MATQPHEPHEILRDPVDSSNLAAIGYDAEACELQVEFKSGAVFSYRNVPGSIYAELMSVPSKGQFYAREIKGRPDTYPSEKLTGVCPKCGDHGWRGRTCEDCGTARYFPEAKREEVGA